MDTEHGHDPVAFAEKLRSWRREGCNVFTHGGRGGNWSRQDFHDLPSVFQQERNHVAEMTKAGVAFERYNASSA